MPPGPGSAPVWGRAARAVRWSARGASHRRQGPPSSCKARGSAEAGANLSVIQVRVIAALAADELEGAGIAAFHQALHDAGPGAAGWPCSRGRADQQRGGSSGPGRAARVRREGHPGDQAAGCWYRCPVSAGRTGAYFQVGSFIICRGLEQHDNAEFRIITGFRQPVRCRQGAAAGGPGDQRAGRCLGAGRATPGLGLDTPGVWNVSLWPGPGQPVSCLPC